MPWRVCSKSASKRSDAPPPSPRAAVCRRSARLPLLVTALLFLTALAAARDLDVEFAVNAAEGTLAVRVGGAPTAAITASLEDGMRAELDLLLRVFEPVGGIAGLLGDRLLAAERVELVLRHDPFVGGYRLERRRVRISGDLAPARRHGTARRTFAGVDEAVAALLAPRGVALPPEIRGTVADAGGPATGRYLRARVRLRPLRLADRLRLVALVLPRYTLRSGWTTVEHPGVPR